MSNLKIVDITTRPDLMREVCTWIWEQWAKDNGRTVQFLVNQMLEGHMNVKNGIPFGYVALLDGQAIGYLELVEDDALNDPEFEWCTPWVACLYIKPEFRNRFFHTALIKKLLERAKALGYKEVFFHTVNMHKTGERMGAEYLGTSTFVGKEVYVMRLKV